MRTIKLKKLIKPINESVNREDLRNPAFVKGMELAIRDKKRGIGRDLGGVKVSENFMRGYEAVMNYDDLGGDSWWDRANDKVTKWVADLGTTFFSNRE